MGCHSMPDDGPADGGRSAPGPATGDGLDEIGEGAGSRCPGQRPAEIRGVVLDAFMAVGRQGPAAAQGRGAGKPTGQVCTGSPRCISSQ